MEMEKKEKKKMIFFGEEKMVFFFILLGLPPEVRAGLDWLQKMRFFETGFWYFAPLDTAWAFRRRLKNDNKFPLLTRFQQTTTSRLTLHKDFTLLCCINL